MSARKLALAAVAALAAALALGAPSKQIRSVNLTEAINRTVCPIRVLVDENADRLPRRIKMMKCAAEPEHWCRSQHLAAHECCQRRHGPHLLECVEMHDTVLVYYKSTGATETYVVSVGCSCMLQQSGSASPLPEGPPAR